MNTSDTFVPDPLDYLYVLPLAGVLLEIRFLFERCLFAPLGEWLNVKNTKRKAPPNKILEEAYGHKPWNNEKIQTLSKKLEVDRRQVERWLRLRRVQDRPTTMKKFCHALWRFTFFLMLLLYGTAMVWNEPWIFNAKERWTGYPHQQITRKMWWYLIIAAAYYVGILFSQFYDVKQKDFWQTCIHHIATIIFLYLNYIANFTRVGSLSLLLHDCSHVPLELAKVAKYAEYHKFAEIIFALFAFVFAITRLMMFPIFVVTSVLEAPDSMSSTILTISWSLAAILFCLHCFWMYLIIQMTIKLFKGDNMQNDIRSCSDEEDSG